VTITVEPTVAAPVRSAKRNATPIVLAVLHPKGGVGRSTTVWQLGAELALRGKRVRIEDLDQGRHLTRVFERHPLGLEGLQLAVSPTGDNNPDLVLLDTAPEAHREHALAVLNRADWLLVPVKGPEEGSVRHCRCSCSG
jgi:cellulose biosynthesis protein BcsQ